MTLSPEEYIKLGEFVRTWVPAAARVGFKIDLADSLGYGTEFDTRESPWLGCLAGLVSCGITRDGKVKGCLSMPDELVEGDLRQNDLWDIWFRPDAFSYTRRFDQDDLGSACRGCDMAAFCKGGGLSHVGRRDRHIPCGSLLLLWHHSSPDVGGSYSLGLAIVGSHSLPCRARFP